jgi:hypothetical protein
MAERRLKVAYALGMVRGTERQLSDAFALLADRHARDAAIRDTSSLMAVWSARHVEALEPLVKKYGRAASERPERLRSALFAGTRVGGLGSLQDMQDISILVTEAELLWTQLEEAAQALRDEEMLNIVKASREQNARQLQWVKTMTKELSAETLTVPSDPIAEFRASVPNHLSIVALPDPIWAPLAVALLTLAVGVPALLFGLQPWLLPSLGPTAFLQTGLPAHPSARLYNVVMGHAGGVIAGFAGVALFNAWNEPVVLTDHQLTALRVGASMVAMLLSMLLGILLRASHPPAAATVLLITLGSLKTIDQLIGLVIGLLILAVVGELFRRLRLGQPSWGRMKAAARSSSST